MNGKPLAEFRIELDLGLHLWQVPDGYCSLHKARLADGTVEYYYSSYTDEFLGNTWEEVLANMGENAYEPVWSTLDAYEGHPAIEDCHQSMDFYYEVGEKWQG